MPVANARRLFVDCHPSQWLVEIRRAVEVGQRLAVKRGGEEGVLAERRVQVVCLQFATQPGVGHKQIAQQVHAHLRLRVHVEAVTLSVARVDVGVQGKAQATLAWNAPRFEVTEGVNCTTPWVKLSVESRL